MPSQITNYQCPACTGPLHFDPACPRHLAGMFFMYNAENWHNLALTLSDDDRPVLHVMTMENGELTNTLKLKRPVICKSYKDVIERMYEEK